MKQTILIEGATSEEILDLPQEHFETLVYTNRPLILRIGTAEILAQFRIENRRLIAEVAHIDGGGEGVLPTFWSLLEKIARKQEMEALEWIVHAVTCARPNLKLRRVLEKRGYVVENVEGVGIAYHKVQIL